MMQTQMLTLALDLALGLLSCVPLVLAGARCSLLAVCCTVGVVLRLVVLLLS